MHQNNLVRGKNFCVLIICSRLRVMSLSAFYAVLKGRKRTGSILENSLIKA